MLALAVVSSWGQEDGEKETDLEGSDFLFRPVYIRYGWQPSSGGGWKGGSGVAQGGGGWGQPYGYGWGSYHKEGGKKKKGKKKKKVGIYLVFEVFLVDWS